VAPGTYYVTAIADFFNVVDEGDDEGNNERSVAITIPFDSGPRIVSQTPTSTISGSVSFVDVTFNEAINSSSFTAADVSVTSSNQSILVTGVSNVSGDTYRISFNGPLTTPDTYTLLIGTGITDTAGNLMNQDGDTTNGESTQDRYSSSFIISAIIGTKYSGRIAADIGSNNRDSIDVFLQRIPGGPLTVVEPIETNLQTWVVIHGKDSMSESFQSMAVAIDEYKAGDQVLVLDWMQGASDNNFPEFLDGAGWIPYVASWATEILTNVLSIASSNLLLVGHSWGSFVAYEIADLMTGGARAIVALDPASGATGGYEEGQVDFSSVSDTSWAFYGDGPFGSDVRSATADEAVVLSYAGSGPPFTFEGHKSMHRAPRNVFETLVRDDGRHQISSLFSLERLEAGGSGPWRLNQLRDTFGINRQVFESRLQISNVDNDGEWGESWSEIVDLEYVDAVTGSVQLIDASELSETAEIDVTDSSGSSTDKAVRLPDTPIGQTSTAATFTLANSGNQALNITNFVKGGNNPNDFEVTVKSNSGGTISGSSFSIGTGKAYTVEVRFNPKAAGAGNRSADITFNTNDPDDNEGSIALTMSGTVQSQPSLILSTKSLSVPEGDNRQFTVRLSEQPSSNVTVDITRQRDGDTDLTHSPTRLTFRTNNWNTPQPVMVSAAQDADMTNGMATFTVSATGLSSVNVTATEADDDIDQWIPWVPTGQQTDIIVSSSNPVTASVIITIGDPGYQVTDWGQVSRQRNTFIVDAKPERWSGDRKSVV
jgi:pimeloyl-ACP methyl ester carboxylesterase